MYLPPSENLAINTLSGIFSDMSESYKIFWFNGILDGISEGKNVQLFDDIVNHMIVDAWYMVTEYHLNLGPSDALEKLIHTLQADCGLPSNAKDKDILSALANTQDKEVFRLKRQLIQFVPYRLQSPFMVDVKGKMWDDRSTLLERINTDETLIYSFGPGKGLLNSIEIQPRWMEYFYTNYGIVSGWVELCLIRYLQRRNPSVPGLADKLRAPEMRKLKKAKDFWKAVIEYVPIQNIYLPGTWMSTKDLSLDHFVPWSYVAHDELWNLVPTTRAVNSSKSNDLPNWDQFFPLLGEVEYSAYCSIWASEHIHALFEPCKQEHVNSNEALIGLYQPGIPKDIFLSHLDNLIKPAYQAAKNLGFKEWKPTIQIGG